MTNPQFTSAALIIGLRRMFKTKTYFCICDLDALLKLAGIIPSKSEHDALRAVHCVDYADMPKEFREALYERVLVMFRAVPDFDENKIIELVAPEPEPEKGALRKLLRL